MEELEARLNALAAENAQMRARIEQLEGAQAAVEERVSTTRQASILKSENLVAMDHEFGYEVLDPATAINRKQEGILQRRAADELADDQVYLSGSVTAIANMQRSNSESKFGYLMRHPTAANQRTKDVSEAAIHSVQLAMTANITDWSTAYLEMLYDPQQSFGSGTNTDLNRNQVQVRRAYIMLGDLEQSPWYASLGKMAIPFGLTDTVSPFTASTVWHAFGGLANGVKLGYLGDGLNVRLMGVQGGAQFRAANMPVDDSGVPSKLNNYAIDLSYSLATGDDSSLLMGGSWLKGSPYCQEYPVTHFSSCSESNAAYDLYARWSDDAWTLLAEYAITEEEWPGTYNPSIPQYAASRVESMALGSKYRTAFWGQPLDLSAEFSRFVAGDNGSPWEKQDQWVLGVASYPSVSSKLFAEVIRTAGYVPLNYISGGSVPTPAYPDNTRTHSESGARSTVFMIGGQLAF